MTDKINKKHITIITLLSLAISIFFLFNFKYPLVSDALIYDDIAKNLAKGFGFSITTLTGPETSMIREPLYPIILAFFHKISNFNYNIFYLFQGVLFALTAILSYFIALEVFKNSRVAFLTGILISISPSMGNYTNHILSENMFTFFLMLTLYLIILAIKDNKNKLYLFSGLVFGLATLTRSFIFPYLILLIPIIIYTGVKSNLNYKKVAASLSIFILGVVLVCVPWLYRNHAKLNAISFAYRGGVLVSVRANELSLKPSEKIPYILSAFSENIAKKYYPNVDVTTLAKQCDKMSFKQLEDFMNQGYTAQEADKLLMKTSTKKILNNIPTFLVFSAVNIIKMHKTFHLPSLPRQENTMPKSYNFIIKLIMKISFYLTLIFMFTGMILDRKNFYLWLIPFSYILFDNIIHSLSYCVPRYAVPLYPLYLMFASLGIMKIVEIIQTKKAQNKES